MKDKRNIKLNSPKCPECGAPMLQTVYTAYNEFVCISCGVAKPVSRGCSSENLIHESEQQEEVCWCCNQEFEDDD